MKTKSSDKLIIMNAKPLSAYSVSILVLGAIWVSSRLMLRALV